MRNFIFILKILILIGLIAMSFIIPKMSFIFGMAFMAIYIDLLQGGYDEKM